MFEYKVAYSSYYELWIMKSATVYEISVVSINLKKNQDVTNY